MGEYLLGVLFFVLFLGAIYPLPIQRQCVAICTLLISVVLILHSQAQI